MFDFSWSEILVIGGVALIVIGPKDLPRALRTAGALVRRARGLARDFHDSVDELMREADLDEAQRNFQRTLGNAFTDDDPPRSIHAPAMTAMTAKPAAAEPAPPPEQQGTLPLAPGEPSHPPHPPEP